MTPDRIRDVIVALAAGVLTLAVTAWVLHLPDAGLRVPFSYGGDNMLTLAAIKGVFAHGWYLSNPSLGAPAGLELYDFPAFSGDALHLLLLKVLSVGISDVVLAENLYYLGGIAASAVTAYAVMRVHGLSRTVGFVLAVVFALSPEHFLRTEGHIFLATTWSLPLAAHLVIEVLSGRPLVTRDAQRGPARAFLTRRTVTTVAICVVMATTDSYYAFFTVALVLGASVVSAVASRRPARLATGLVVVAVAGGVLVLEQLPSLVYWSGHGRNDLVAQRTPQESDVYGLKVSDMLLPVPGHRIDALADVRDRYEESRLPVGGGGGLGALGAATGLALLVSVGLLVAAAAGRARPPGSPLERPAAVAALSAVLFGSVGGFGVLFAYVVDPQFRGLGRIAMLVALFALMAVGPLLDRGLAALRRRRAGGLVVYPLAAVLLWLAILDQTSPRMTPPYEANRAEYRSDAQFVRAIESVLGPGASIFQLPYAEFPEVPSNVGGGHLRGYLHSGSLRWSYPAMRGRDEDWQKLLDGEPAERVVKAVAAAGFAGLWLDRRGYEDRGAEIEGKIAAIAGPASAVSSDQQLVFWDLRDIARRLAAGNDPGTLTAAREDTVLPLRLRFGAGFDPVETSPEGTDFHWAGAEGRVDVVNHAGHPRETRVTLNIATATGEPANATVVWPGGDRQSVAVPAGGTRLVRRLTAQPGLNTVTISTDAAALPDAPRERRIVILDPTLAPNAAFSLTLPDA
jgi:phosphoglycerol transferase